MTGLAYIDAAGVRRSASWLEAIDSIEQFIAQATDLDAAIPRNSVPVRRGELLIMPAESESSVGVKIASVAPANPDLGLPRIQAIYVLLDAHTLAPKALIDGTALTSVRTAAQSAMVVRHLARPDVAHLVLFGSGPQAEAHVKAIRAVRPLTAVTVVARNKVRLSTFVADLRSDGLDAKAGTAEAVSQADVVVCATTARSPLFDGNLLAEDACVIAVGSHEPSARELDSTVFARAGLVVVEGSKVALREAGDIIQAIDAGTLTPDRLVDLSAMTRLPAGKGIRVFKSVGVGWQDLAVAESIYSGWTSTL